MISINKYNDKPSNLAVELYGLSTDTKPTGIFEGIRLANGSTFYAMDTKAVYIYDEENERWLDV